MPVTMLPRAMSLTPSGALAASSPVAATTFLGTGQNGGMVLGLDEWARCIFDLTLTGGTGGTLDVYIQSSVTGGATWFDIAHAPQIAAGSAAARFTFTVGRSLGVASMTATNVSDGTPALAANTVVANGMGDSLRVVYVAGAGTSAGAPQVVNIKLFPS